MQKHHTYLACALVSLSAAVPSTRAALTFEFNYLPGSGFLDESFGAARQAALHQAANIFGSYFTAYSANLTFTVGEETVPTALASANSPLAGSPLSSGLYNTVVQEKILTGWDDNGAAADGFINWNFSFDWNLGPVNAPEATGQPNLIPTALHELTHTLGFGLIADADVVNFAVWSGLLTNRFGTPLFALSPEERASTIVGGSSLDGEGNLVPSLNGVYFAGENAVTQNGDLVPIYSPSQFVDGSSLSHLDVLATGIQNMMDPFSLNPENEPLGYSALEIAMLKDLGYTQINSSAIPEPAQAGVLAGLVTLCLAVLPRRRARA